MARLLLVALLLSGCDVGCGSDEVTRVVSPDERLKAVRYVRWCDPDGEHFTHVSVVGRWAPISGEGNAFSCDAAPEEVRIQWYGDRLLRVSYPGTAKVQKKVTPVEGVTIEYAGRGVSMVNPSS